MLFLFAIRRSHIPVDVSANDSPSGREGSLKNSEMMNREREMTVAGKGREGGTCSIFRASSEKPIHIKSGPPKISRNSWAGCTSAVGDTPFRTFCRFIILSPLRRRLTGLYLVSRAWSKDDFSVKVLFFVRRECNSQFWLKLQVIDPIINYWSKIDWSKINGNLLKGLTCVVVKKKKWNSTIRIAIVKATNVEW